MKTVTVLLIHFHQILDLYFHSCSFTHNRRGFRCTIWQQRSKRRLDRRNSSSVGIAALVNALKVADPFNESTDLDPFNESVDLGGRTVAKPRVIML